MQQESTSVTFRADPSDYGIEVELEDSRIYVWVSGRIAAQFDVPLYAVRDNRSKKTFENSSW